MQLSPNNLSYKEYQYNIVFHYIFITETLQTKNKTPVSK